MFENNDMTYMFVTEQLPGYLDLKKITGLYESVQLDESRTCVFWNDYIDLPSDTIYEYGKKF